MRKIVSILVILLVSFSLTLGQVDVVVPSSTTTYNISGVTSSSLFASDTTDLKGKSAADGKTCYLKGLTTSSDVGAGWFVYGDSTEPEGGIAFGASEHGKQWVRVDYLRDHVIYPEWLGAKGDGVTNDRDAIQDALDLAYELRENVSIPSVELHKERYSIDSTLILYRGSILELNGKNTRLEITTDYPIIKMNTDSRLTGGMLSISSTVSSSYTSSAILIDDVNNNCYIDHVLIRNDNQTGTAIEFTPASSNDYVQYAFISNVGIYKFEYGIKLNNLYSSSWVNAIVFNNINLIYNLYPIYLNSSHGNQFNNVAIECYNGSTSTIKLYDSDDNKFTNIESFDFVGDTTIYFDENSDQNIVSVFNGSNYTMIDKGDGNRIVNLSNNYGMQYPNQAFIVAGGNPWAGNFVGDQSDYFAFADQRFTVTQEFGDVISSGSISNMFDADPYSNALWHTTGDSVGIKIKFDSKKRYFSAMTIDFLSIYIPDTLKVYMWKDTNSVAVKYKIYENYDLGANIVKIIPSAGIRRTTPSYVTSDVDSILIVFKENNHYTSITGIHGYFSKYQGTTWLPRNGGEIWGRIQPDIFNFPASEPSSPMNGDAYYKSGGSDPDTLLIYIDGSWAKFISQ